MQGQENIRLRQMVSICLSEVSGLFTRDVLRLRTRLPKPRIVCLGFEALVPSENDVRNASKPEYCVRHK